MTVFGTSAYMRILALNPRPQMTAIKKRLVKSGRGYDFHKAGRRIATDFAAGATFADVRAALRAIERDAERKSAISATFALKRWIGRQQIRPIGDSPLVARSPNGVFSVKFSPDFEMLIDNVPTIVHLWNTQNPRIRIREAIGAIGLFLDNLDGKNLAVLSLKSGELFLPAHKDQSISLAHTLAARIEKLYLTAESDIRADNAQREHNVRHANLRPHHR